MSCPGRVLCPAGSRSEVLESSLGGTHPQGRFPSRDGLPEQPPWEQLSRKKQRTRTPPAYATRAAPELKSCWLTATPRRKDRMVQ